MGIPFADFFGDIAYAVAKEVYYSKTLRRLLIEKVDEAATEAISYISMRRKPCPKCGYVPSRASDDTANNVPSIVPLN